MTAPAVSTFPVSNSPPGASRGSPELPPSNPEAGSSPTCPYLNHPSSSLFIHSPSHSFSDVGCKGGFLQVHKGSDSRGETRGCSCLMRESCTVQDLQEIGGAFSLSCRDPLAPLSPSITKKHPVISSTFSLSSASSFASSPISSLSTTLSSSSSSSSLVNSPHLSQLTTSQRPMLQPKAHLGDISQPKALQTPVLEPKGSRRDISQSKASERPMPRPKVNHRLMSQSKASMGDISQPEASQRLVSTPKASPKAISPPRESLQSVSQPTPSLWGFLGRMASLGTSGRPQMSGKGRATPTWPFHAQSRTHAWNHGRSELGWALLVLTLQLLAHITPASAHVVGENMRCHQEGEAVAVPKELFKDNPCLECVCENGIVVCNKRKCPSMEGCYWSLEPTGGSCCQECKGCIHEGKMYKHGSNWTDGCTHYECQSGVLTVSQTQCHLTCYTSLPLQERKCCQRCQGCWFEGRHVPEGETVSSRADPCIQCTCSKGNLSCEKKACPVLSCPPSRQVPLPNSCCKTCIGSRNLMNPPNGRCFLNSHLYLSGGDRTIDPCTVCTCHQGYITCQRHTCPVLNCSREFQIVLENECCPTCSAAAELENVCRVPGMVRKHGEEWQLDKCTSCKCTDGETSCWMISCEYGNKPCPPGYRRIESENECCPRCEEAPGVCTVFGDPHYLTFDGMLFNFQGACRYTLVRSCKGSSFSLKVNNDARRSALFSWTKSLLLNLPGKKVKLGQKLRTKVNKRRVKMKYPYNDPSGLIITREGLAMKIATPEGIKILWDGASYVEVEVPVHMQGKVCGLCGNFNRNITDDLTTYDGKMMATPDQMAMSWSTGKPKKCSVKMKDGERRRLQRQNCPESKEGLTQCSMLNSTMFQSCHAVAPIDQFYNSCVLDMCECKSSRRCECDTIQAYARHCERLGIAIPDWRKISNCGGLECPHGAEYMECAPPCRPTCRNPHPNPDCYTRRCREGCFCPPRTVLHRGTCIPMQECPRRGKKRHRNS